MPLRAEPLCNYQMHRNAVNLQLCDGSLYYTDMKGNIVIIDRLSRDLIRESEGYSLSLVKISITENNFKIYTQCH